jgi:rhodanese-related sulfurtransferase
MPELKKILLFSWTAAMACVFLFRPSVLAAQDAGAGYRELSPAEARESIAKRAGDPGFVLLDVRTPKEFDAERIESAVMVDYLSPSFREEIGKFDRSKTYLVYCRTGNRTMGALTAMRELGFGSLLHLQGGITKWKQAGFPTSR